MERKREKKMGICRRSVMPLWEEAGEDGLADEMLAGWIYEVLEEKGGFLRIRTHYAYEGWMDAAEYAPVPANEKSRRSMYMVGVHAADVLAGPKVQEKRLITLFAGSLVSICEESRTQDDWVRIALPDGREGYTRTHFLMPRRDSDAFLESGRLLELPELDEDGEAALRQEIVDRALSFLGTQYRWGGSFHELSDVRIFDLPGRPYCSGIPCACHFCGTGSERGSVFLSGACGCLSGGGPFCPCHRLSGLRLCDDEQPEGNRSGLSEGSEGKPCCCGKHLPALKRIQEPVD